MSERVVMRWYLVHPTVPDSVEPIARFPSMYVTSCCSLYVHLSYSVHLQVPSVEMEKLSTSLLESRLLCTS